MPSKYDRMAQKVFDQTGAECVILVVVRGSQGSGAAAKARLNSPLAEPRRQTRLLRAVADMIDRDGPTDVSIGFYDVPEPKGDA